MQKLLAIQTHPIQYWAPLYRILNQDLNINTTVVYGSDFSVKGYKDREFNSDVSWDVDLLSGYKSHFLTSVTVNPDADRISKLNTNNLSGIIGQTQPDVILLTGYSPKFNLISALTAFRSKIPVILRCETTDVSQQRTKFKSFSRDCLLKMLYSKIRGFAYIGTESRKHYLRLGIQEDKLTFSPYCVAKEPVAASQKLKWRTEIRTAMGIPETRIVLIFSGKMIRKKSPDHILMAAKHLPDHILKNLSVVFLGDGNLRQSMQTMNENRMFASVHYIGFVNQSEIQKYYAAADFLSLNSLFEETWGLVINEALAAGIPCITSDKVGCHPDLILEGKTGFTYPSGHIRQLADRIIRMTELARDASVPENCQKLIERYSSREAALGIKNAADKAFRECLEI